MQRENWQMKQHILDLRRAMRKEGIEANSSLFTYPDLEKSFQNETQSRQSEKYRYSFPFQDLLPSIDTSQDLCQIDTGRCCTAFNFVLTKCAGEVPLEFDLSS